MKFWSVKNKFHFTKCVWKYSIHQVWGMDNYLQTRWTVVSNYACLIFNGSFIKPPAAALSLWVYTWMSNWEQKLYLCCIRQGCFNPKWGGKHSKGVFLVQLFNLFIDTCQARLYNHRYLTKGTLDLDKRLFHVCLLVVGHQKIYHCGECPVHLYSILILLIWYVALSDFDFPMQGPNMSNIHLIFRVRL